MIRCTTIALKYDELAGLSLLDQTLLPHQKVWRSIKKPEQMIEAIQALRIRGAPLIGIAASLFWAHWLQEQTDVQLINNVYQNIRKSRPTAINLINNLDECYQVFQNNPQQKRQVLEKAKMLFDADVQLCQKMAENCASRIQTGDHILTYCNTGSLATAGRGTALGAITWAHEQGKKIMVYVGETRPLGQGARLTFWELQQVQMKCTLICDNMIGSLMAQKSINKIFVGADRITKKYDIANKIGTYSIAVLAKHHGIPFYVVAPSTTFDRNIDAADHIPIEQRPDQEILTIWNLHQGSVWNPCFDVTPHHLISGIITESEIIEL